MRVMSEVPRTLEEGLRRVPALNRLVRNVGSPASRGRRLQALWKTLYFDTRTRLLKKPTVAPIGVRSKIICYPGETNSPHAAYRNPPNPREMSVWQKHLKPGDLFMDVGANIGIYTIFALDLGAEVIACEPDPHNYQRILEHLGLNGYEAEVLNVAVADRPGSLLLTQGLDSFNHLVHLNDDEPEDVIEVSAMPIDDIIGDRHVAGLKIDVEGAESLVIAGAERALMEQRIDLMQLEWSNRTYLKNLNVDRDPIADALRNAGYQLYRPNYMGELHLLDGPVETNRGDVFAAPAGFLNS